MRKIKGGNFIKLIIKVIFIGIIFIIELSTSARAGVGYSSLAYVKSGDFKFGAHSFSKTITDGQIWLIVVGIGTVFAIIYLASKDLIIKRKRNEIAKTIKKLHKFNSSWNYIEIKKDIEEAFYQVKNAWSERDYAWAIDYMSKQLYTDHIREIEFMRMKFRRNIIKKLKIISIEPIRISINSNTGYKALWVNIKAEGIYYTVNEIDNEIVNGSKDYIYEFTEYWKFVKSNGRWVVSKISKVDDIDEINFIKIDIS